MAIITISRGSYSRGKEIAEKVAAKLDYSLLSRDILLQASEEFNIPEIRLVRALHDAPSVLERWGLSRYRKTYDKWLFFIIALGIVLPTMHQSGLGGLVVAAGDKVSPLWGTPWIAFLFRFSD